MTATLAAWQHGHELEELRSLRAYFDIHDAGLCRGAYTAVNDATIADWLERGRLTVDRGCAIAWRHTRTAGQLFDFTGQHAAHLPAGTLRVDRWAGTDYGLAHFVDAARRTVRAGCVRGWAERDSATLDDIGLERLATKVTASSELVGFWGWGLEHRPLARADIPALAPLGYHATTDHLAAELESAGVWAEHYSAYNRRHSWHAIALRGYGGSLDIEKPSEMAKGWKAEHPDWRDRTCQWTDAALRFPRLTNLARTLAPGAERVRLMRLDGGGQLDRHADITDPDAGTADGKLMRLHLPLATNPDVVFGSWELDGRYREAHMPTGSLWYLDTRKPHSARNAGPAARIHLVIDAPATPELRRRLELAADA